MFPSCRQLIRFTCVVMIFLSKFAWADADAEFARAEFFDEKGLYSASLLQFDRFLQKYPDDPRHSVAKLRIGKALYFQEDYESAELVLEKLWRDDRTPYSQKYIDDLYVYLIETKIMQGNVDEADQLAQGYSLRYWYKSAYTDILYRMAEAWYFEGNYGRARRYLTKMDELDVDKPQSVYAIYMRGIIAVAEENWRQVEDYLKRVIKTPVTLHRSPEEMAMLKDQARLKLADYYFQQEQYEEALKFYRAIKNFKLWGDRRYLGLAWCRFMLLDYDEAIKNAQKLVVEYPDGIYQGEAEFLQGICFLDIGDPVFAVLHFENFLNLLEEFESKDMVSEIKAKIALEQEKLRALSDEIRDLEETLVYLPQSDVSGPADRIIKRKEEVTYMGHGIESLYDRLEQRNIEMQLKVEAEYGLNKARLLATRPGN